MGFDPQTIVDCVEELLAEHAGGDPFIPLGGVDQDAAQKMVPIPGGGGGHILLTDTGGETWLLTIQRCSELGEPIVVDTSLARAKPVRKATKKKKAVKTSGRKAESRR